MERSMSSLDLGLIAPQQRSAAVDRVERSLRPLGLLELQALLVLRKWS